MEKPTVSAQLLRSKLLCFSLIYLLSAACVSLSSTKCIFRSLSADPIQPLRFSYPSSYGQHKYAVPTTRSSCNSPVYFSDYLVVLRRMQRLWEKAADLGAGTVTYMEGNAESFGGNLSFHNRVSYFDQTEIPCGFFRRFPISGSDQLAMEKCNKLVVVSAIFNDHDKIRQPKNLGSKTLDQTCFFMFVDEITLTRLHFHNLISNGNKTGVWRIVKVSSEDLYENAAMNGVIPKHLIHRLFPHAKHSIWVDAKLQLVIDPLLLIDALVGKEGVDMAVSKHPYFVHTMEEAMATLRWKKWWDVDGLKVQMETYCENGLEPWNSNKSYPSDVPDSALILRKHSAATNMFSCLLFNELEGFNPRDQLPFAFVRDKINLKLSINMFEVEVFEQVAVEYRHNLNKGGAKLNWAGPNLFGDEKYSRKCEGYLSKMWGESQAPDV